MQTPPVLNPTGVLPGSAPGAKPVEQDNAPMPFNQVLSREMADRGNTAEAQKAADSRETAPAAPADASASKPRAGKAADENKSEDAHAADDDSASPAADAGAADAAAQASADMLALVASLAPARPQEVADAAGKVAVESGQVAQAVGEARTAKANIRMPGTDTALPKGSIEKAEGKAPSQPLAQADKPVSVPEFTRAGARPAATAGAEKETLQPVAKDAPALAPAAPSGRERVPEGAATGPGRSAFSLEATDGRAATAPSAATAPGMQGLQQAALHAAPPPGMPVSDKLSPQVGTPAWNQALGQRVVWMVAGEQQTASLTLNPPDLGPLQVVLNVSNSTANATFTSAQPEVRQAIEAAMPRLRDMLGEAGIQLGQATVGSGSPDQQQAFERQAAGGSGGWRRTESAEMSADSAPRTARVQPAIGGRGLVDTFV